MWFNKYFNNLNNPDIIFKSEYWSLEKLESFQNKRLKLILNYSYNNIPGYRAKFDEAGIVPSDIKTKEDLKKFPITTREELQSNPDFVNTKLITETLYTGGSTGTSLKYYESELAGKMRWNAHLRGWSWNGYAPGKRLAVITSAQGVIGGDNTINLSGDLTDQNLKINLEEIMRFKPEHLRGYVSSIYILAKYILDNGIYIEGIQSIDPISENLYDYQREIIERAFHCKVFEEYCCNDGGACAWECEKHEGLHYVMERAIIEEVEGEIVVTDLWNMAMPFIRYKNGDAIKFFDKKCSCGRVHPLISVKGRTNDIIISKDGPISPTFLMYHGIGYVDQINKNFRSGISMVQYIQKENFVLEINIVKNSWCTDDEIIDFKNKLTEIAKGMTINYNFVDSIPKTEKGKRNFIINEDKKLLKQWGYQ